MIGGISYGCQRRSTWHVGNGRVSEDLKRHWRERERERKKRSYDYLFIFSKHPQCLAQCVAINVTPATSQLFHQSAPTSLETGKMVTFVW